MPRVLRAPEACRAVKTGCDVSSGLLPSIVASARPVDTVLSPSWLRGEESDPTEELLWKSAVSSGIQGVMGCTRIYVSEMIPVCCNRDAQKMVQAKDASMGRWAIQGVLICCTVNPTYQWGKQFCQ